MDNDLNVLMKRAWSFYENNVYSGDYIQEHKLFDETKEIFNPVPKIVYIMNALTMQKTISIEAIERSKSDVINKRVQEIWQANNFQNMKYILGLWLMLSRKAIIELNKKDNDIVISLHDPCKVELKKSGSKIIYAKISGEIERFNFEKKEFEKVQVEKEYFNVDGYKRRIEKYDGKVNKATSGPLAFEFIPIVEFETDYNLEPIYNKIDSYNQIEAFLNAIFFIHGDPIIWDTLTGKQISEDAKEKIKSKRGKALKMMHLGEGAKMQYLEMQGNVAKLMLEKQKSIEEIIANDYPEYTLAKLLSQGDPSGEALEIKAIEIVSKVNSLRGDLNTGIVEMDNMALRMLGLSELDHKVNFGDILPTNTKSLVDMIKELRGINLITRKTAMGKIPEIIPDPQAELDALEAEDEEIRKQISEELSSH